jgi:nitrite reductase/ring-hydroxylating ferredoxin subunit
LRVTWSSRDNAAMTSAASNQPCTDEGWQPLAGVDAINATFPTRAKLGEEWIIVFRTATGLRGTQRACPHQQSTMMDAVEMGGGAMLRCPRHNYVFRLADGRGVNCPGYRLTVYEIREEAGVLYARRSS